MRESRLVLAYASLYMHTNWFSLMTTWSNHRGGPLSMVEHTPWNITPAYLLFEPAKAKCFTVLCSPRKQILPHVSGLTSVTTSHFVFNKVLINIVFLQWLMQDLDSMMPTVPGVRRSRQQTSDLTKLIFLNVILFYFVAFIIFLLTKLVFFNVIFLLSYWKRLSVHEIL